MNKHINLSLAIAALFLGSCMVGSKYKQPEPPPVTSYAAPANSDTTALLKWFDLFKDTALQSIIRTTLENNKDLLTAAYRVEEARLQTDIIRINQYPAFGYDVQAGGGTSGTDAQKVGVGVNNGFFKAIGVLNWEIDLWGKLKRATAAAQAQYLATDEIRNSLKVSLVAQAASQYFLLRDLDNELLIAQKTLESRKENTKIITDRFNKGYTAELDKFQAIQQEAQAAAFIPRLNRQITVVENAINLLMAKPSGPVARGVTIYDQILPPDIPAGLPSQLLQRRPDIRASEKLLQSQFERIGIAQANMYPSFSLTGLLGFASPQLNTFLSNGFVANGFGGLTGPIFQFNQNKKRVEIEKIRTQQARMQYEQTVLAAFADVNNALIATRTLAEEYDKTKIQVDAGRKALELTNAKYNYSYTSYLDVLIQENNVFAAELQESALKQQSLSAIVNLYKALGGGWN